MDPLANSTKLQLGAVAIGRNEGERLRLCLQSLITGFATVVYVDSGSSDDSVAIAEGLGVHVVHLNCQEGFTAARARNSGVNVLLELSPNLQIVQFIDGDCELAPDWARSSAEFLLNQAAVGAVCGRCRERAPRKNIYHRLADMEWDTPNGEVKACGGIALVRVAALTAAGGFRNEVIAAEDDDLCVRMREHGWKIVKLDREMVMHDASIDRFSQWWRRMIRTGNGFAQVYWLNRRNGLRHFRREVLRTVFWGCILPLIAMALTWITGGISLLIALAMYAASGLRAYRYRRRLGSSRSDAVTYACWISLSKLPSAIGVLRFWAHSGMRRRPQIIEYKTAIHTES